MCFTKINHFNGCHHTATEVLQCGSAHCYSNPPQTFSYPGLCRSCAIRTLQQPAFQYAVAPSYPQTPAPFYHSAASQLPPGYGYDMQSSAPYQGQSGYGMSAAYGQQPGQFWYGYTGGSQTNLSTNSIPSPYQPAPSPRAPDANTWYQGDGVANGPGRIRHPGQFNAHHQTKGHDPNSSNRNNYHQAEYPNRNGLHQTQGHVHHPSSQNRLQKTESRVHETVPQSDRRFTKHNDYKSTDAHSHHSLPRNEAHNSGHVLKRTGTVEDLSSNRSSSASKSAKSEPRIIDDWSNYQFSDSDSDDQLDTPDLSSNNDVAVDGHEEANEPWWQYSFIIDHNGCPVLGPGFTVPGRNSAVADAGTPDSRTSTSGAIHGPKAPSTQAHGFHDPHDPTDGLSELFSAMLMENGVNHSSSAAPFSWCAEKNLWTRQNSDGTISLWPGRWGNPNVMHLANPWVKPQTRPAQVLEHHQTLRTSTTLNDKNTFNKPKDSVTGTPDSRRHVRFDSDVGVIHMSPREREWATDRVAFPWKD